MAEALPEIYLARHGETAWTVTGQHTGRTDLPLTDRGERNAGNLRDRLRGLTFDRSSPARSGVPGGPASWPGSAAGPRSSPT